MPVLEDLIQELKSKRVLNDPRLEAAFRKVDRALFVPGEFIPSAYLDEALPLNLRSGKAIGPVQTISQPYTVAFMLEKLQVEPGQQILDIGYGSGWQAALLAELVAPSGHVYAMEIAPEVCDFGRQNISKFPELAERISLYCQSGESGLPEVSKKVNGFDRIIAAASIPEVPIAWREQLKKGGRLVYPNGYSLMVETKLKDGRFIVEKFPGFIFVPFVK